MSWGLVCAAGAADAVYGDAVYGYGMPLLLMTEVIAVVQLLQAVIAAGRCGLMEPDWFNSLKVAVCG